MSAEGGGPGVGGRGRGRGVGAAGRSASTGSRSASPATGSRTAEGDVVVFVLPGQLRDLIGGRSQVPVPPPSAGTVEGAFVALRRSSPAVYDRIFTEQGELRPHVNVFVDGADIRWAGGLETPVRSGSEVVILPAVSGG